MIAKAYGGLCLSYGLLISLRHISSKTASSNFFLRLLNVMQMRNSHCHHQWQKQWHQQIKNCLGSLVVFGMHIDVLWKKQILCSGHRRSQNNLDAATRQNLDIAGLVCNLLTCNSCTTLCKCQKEFCENTDAIYQPAHFIIEASHWISCCSLSNVARLW